MELKRKLTARIGKLIIALLIITITIIMIGTTIASFRQMSRIYNDRTMQVAKQVSEVLNGDDMSFLLSCVDNDEYREIREQAAES